MPARLAWLVAVTTLLLLATGPAAHAAEPDGLTVKRVVLTDATGKMVDAFRARPDGTWERRQSGGFWKPVKLLDRTKHVVWFFDAAGNEELRVAFPDLGVRTRPASAQFPNTNAWQTSPLQAQAFLARGTGEEPKVTGLTVRQITLTDVSGVVVGRYRERVPATNPVTWEAQDPGRPWRGPIRVVDRTEHVLWLFDESDKAELRFDFPGLAVKSRPSSKVFPNPMPWTVLPLTAKAGATAATPEAPKARMTFFVINQTGKAIELFQPAHWPPVGTEGVLVDRLHNGQTRTYTADAGMGWVIRTAAPPKRELKRFQITKQNQRIVLRPSVPPPPPTVPKPVPKPVRTQTLSITGTVERLGGWKHLSGDPDMDTNSNDRVPVKVKSRLSYTADGVYVDIYFHVQEFRGDGTAYGGHWDTVKLFTKANGKIPADARVVGIEPPGGAGEREWSFVTIGRQHQLIPVKTHGTYWDDLFVLVDSPKKGDGAHVGVRGTITLAVTVER